jgi:hypothetical protein
LREAAKGTYYDNDTLLLMARYNRNEKQNLSGLISASDYKLELNRLRSSVTYTLELLAKEVPEKMGAEVPAKKDAPNSEPVDAGQQETTRQNPDSPSAKGPVRVFIFYDFDDEQWSNGLQKQLRILERNKKIEVWQGLDINAGLDWDKEIRKELEKAEIVLLLVSPDYLHSEYIAKVEQAIAAKRFTLDEIRLIPVIIRPCPWRESKLLSPLMALPKRGKPVSTWEHIDEAWLNVVEGVSRVVKDLRPAAD